MKKVLLATSFLVAGAGFAAAEVTLSGSARMGIIDDFGSSTDVGFTSRARVVFTLTGSSDSGLEFGASFRADNASGANNGTAGNVWVSGAFGKLSMGDVDGAAENAVGDVSGVGLTGLGDLNETIYLGAGGDLPGGVANTTDPTALYEYSTGAFTGYLSSTNPTGASTAYSLGAKYSAGAYTVGFGYENADTPTEDLDQWLLGASATFGAATLKAVYGSAESSLGGEGDQWGVSVDYAVDALTVTAFYRDAEEFTGWSNGVKSYGLGASYDLGGGASVKGGYVKDDTNDENAFDLGLNFAF